MVLNGVTHLKNVHIRSVLVCFCFAITANSYPQFNEKSDSIVLDSLILSQMEENHIPGMATCVVKGNQTIWKRCYGYASMGKNLMVNDSTSFPLASVTKPVTGTALMQLWEMGLFDLDDNINDYMPEGVSVINPFHPEKAISFRMLLTHTSSIKYNFENSYDSLYTFGYETPISLDSFVVNYFTPGGTYYDSTNYDPQPPGTKYEYSNEGIDLAGYLAGVIAGIPFCQYCKDHIFNPMNMSHTGWLQSDLDTNNLATQYIFYEEEYNPIPFVSGPGIASHLLKSSVNDLARFLVAFLNDGEIDQVRILNKETVQLMNTIQYPSIAPDIGLVWLFEFRNGTEIWWHRGGDWGVSTWITYSPEKNLGIIILSNMTQWETDLDEIYDALFEYGMVHTTEVNEHNHKGMSIYPNPTNNILTIYTNDYNQYNIRITSLNGQLIFSEEIEGPTQQIDLSSFRKGIYFITIRSKDYVTTRKIIKM